ncbi:hypothetical protein [Paenarthrobacter nitroguajacolicus]|nr:hypothetical protein [Paenarthrobacter nitroguajacolicus]MDR6637014.1 hypothetical protein [Paenarthrobacter nitroguajacolicus]
MILVSACGGPWRVHSVHVVETILEDLSGVPFCRFERIFHDSE